MGNKFLKFEYLLLFAVFTIATCGLVYELVAGTLASYLLGDSVKQFSFIIGVYLFSMGIGSYFSKFITKNLLNTFVEIEILVGLIGGLSSVVLFLLFETAFAFQFILYFLVFVTGCLVGLEIPLLMNILKDKVEFKDLVSNVFTFDYIGALLASILFPLILVPKLGIMGTSLFFGMINISIAIVLCYLLKSELKKVKLLRAKAIFSFLVLLVTFFFSENILSYSEGKLYGENIIYTNSTQYQRIVLTHNKSDYRLYLNNNLQFSSADEYRYHEALVHPIMAAHGAPKKIAVLGGGDGMAVREILRYASVESITLVELDPNMTRLFQTHPDLIQLNQKSLLSNKVKIVNADAFKWLEENTDYFDIIIVDFPDPTNFNVGKLYTNSFYSLLEKRLNAGAYAVIQTTSPLIARQTFWTVAHTIESVGLQATPYHAHVPSFGEWGFVIASRRPYRLPTQLPAKLQFLTAQSLPQLFIFPPDMARVPSDINRLSNQILVNTYEQEWGKIVH